MHCSRHGFRQIWVMQVAMTASDTACSMRHRRWPLPASSPVAAVSCHRFSRFPSRLFYSAFKDALTLRVDNVGGGALTLDRIDVDVPWLTVSARSVDGTDSELR